MYMAIRVMYALSQEDNGMGEPWKGLMFDRDSKEMHAKYLVVVTIPIKNLHH
jgi:hypothetical protein